MCLDMMAGTGMMGWMWFFGFIWVAVSVAILVLLVLLIMWFYKKIIAGK